VTLTSHRSALKITSTCSEFTGIVYASALKGSKTTPCTNVPVICELCAHATNSKTIPAIWRYNLEAHIKASDVLAWLGLEATGFGLALGGFGFWDPQAKP